MNFALSDGITVLCSRYVDEPGQEPASLFYSSGTRFECFKPGHYRMLKEDKRPKMTIIASEPLTFERSDWVAIPRNTLMVVTKKHNPLFYSIK